MKSTLPPAPTRATIDVVSPRRIVFVVFDDIQPLDLVGPHEVFAGVNRLRGESAYRVDVACLSAGSVRTESGLSIAASVALERVRGPIDTLICVGGFGTREARHNAELIRNIKRLAARARRVTSVCTGAILLAEAGLLDGRRAVTHWAACDWLAKQYPLVKVELDPIYVRDAEVWTSAGVTAGIDLALAMVADDFELDGGDQIVRQIARWLVVFSHRPGGQAQFSESLALPIAPTDAIRRVITTLPTRLKCDCSVPRLAEQAAMSERTFARRFRAETGRTPADHVERLRVEAAKTQLQQGMSLPNVARTCGFGTIETLHRAFRRRVGTTPDLYRQHFANNSSVH